MSAREFQHHFADLGEVTIHYVTAGSGLADRPPIVLLHGWPQTWYEWRHVMARLAEHHPVIAPDLRGLGDSSRPLEGYDKRTVANDIFRLLAKHLGLERWHCVGHDWGGPGTFALGAWHPESMLTMTIIDVVIPGAGDFSQGGRRWHHAFHLTPDLPEALVTGRERAYLGWFYREFSWRRGAIDAAAVDEYLRTYTEPGTLRAGLAMARYDPNNLRPRARVSIRDRASRVLTRHRAAGILPLAASFSDGRRRARTRPGGTDRRRVRSH